MSRHEAAGTSQVLTWVLGVPVEGCAEAVGTGGPSGASGLWKAGAFYRILHGERDGDVVECITTTDLLTLEDVVASSAVRDPAAIDNNMIVVETDGDGGAIDRAVFVQEDGVLILVVANLHSPVPEGQNLTRDQVDGLVAAAVRRVDTQGWLGESGSDQHGGGLPGARSATEG